jgi:formate hydrogenlyase subunit 3/multisubunit Na+/H+ antiporter MnhD subunit
MELFFTIIILPIYLVLTNYYIAKRHNKANEIFFINGLIILSCIFVSTHFHFKNWADSVGNYTKPDSGTDAINQFTTIAGIIVCLIGLLFVFFRIRFKLNAKLKTTLLSDTNTLAETDANHETKT